MGKAQHKCNSFLFLIAAALPVFAGWVLRGWLKGFNCGGGGGGNYLFSAILEQKRGRRAKASVVVLYLMLCLTSATLIIPAFRSPLSFRCKSGVVTAAKFLVLFKAVKALCVTWLCSGLHSNYSQKATILV